VPVLHERLHQRDGQQGSFPAAISDGHDSNGDGGSPSAWCADADLDTYVKELVDAAPPLTAEQRDILALLLRRPRRR
jgi:hypothetical protein